MPTKSRQTDISKSEVIKRAEADAEPSVRNVKVAKTTASPAADPLAASVTFFAGACICTLLFFANPIFPNFETYRLVNAALLLWIPLMLVMLFFKHDVQHFGMTRGDRKLGLHYTAWAIVLMIPVLVVASLMPGFRSHYSGLLNQQLAMFDFPVTPTIPPTVLPLGLLYYELIMGFYLFCWEYFFRGFLLFGLARAKFLGNNGAILLQAIPFALLHWSVVPSASKPIEEIIGAFFGGLLLGWLAVRTKSFFYGFVIHWAIAIGFDMLIVVPLLVHPK